MGTPALFYQLYMARIPMALFRGGPPDLVRLVRAEGEVAIERICDAKTAGHNSCGHGARLDVHHPRLRVPHHTSDVKDSRDY